MQAQSFCSPNLVVFCSANNNTFTAATPLAFSQSCANGRLRVCQTGLDVELLGALQGNMHAGMPDLPQADIPGTWHPTPGYWESIPGCASVCMTWRVVPFSCKLK